MDRIMGFDKRKAATEYVNLQFTEQALDDLVRLREFIAEKNPAAAQRISEQLIDHIQRLRDQPEIGRELETLPGIREWIARDYVVHYLVLSNVLIVLQIWHGKEDRE